MSGLIYATFPLIRALTGVQVSFDLGIIREFKMLCVKPPRATSPPAATAANVINRIHREACRRGVGTSSVFRAAGGI